MNAYSGKLVIPFLSHPQLQLLTEVVSINTTQLLDQLL